MLFLSVSKSMYVRNIIFETENIDTYKNAVHILNIRIITFFKIIENIVW